MIRGVSWQKLGRSTRPSHGASAHHLGSGVVYGVLQGVTDASNGWRSNLIYRPSRFLLYNLAKAEFGLGNARPRWHSTSLRSATACTPLPWQVWGGLGNDANVLDVKMESRAPLNIQSLGDNL
jgi:hypothetical protein